MKVAGMVEDGNGRWTMRNIEDCSACRSAFGGKSPMGFSLFRSLTAQGWPRKC